MTSRSRFLTITSIVTMAIVVVVAAFATAVAGPKDGKGPKGPKGPKNPKPTETVAPTPTPTSSPTATPTQDPDPEPPGDSAEAEFIRMMIPHHHQALLMSELAPGRTSKQDLLGLADRIIAEQTVEINTMQFWQEYSGEPVTDAATAYAAMLGMPMMVERMGMASQAEMDQLAASSGAAFDQLYLELMIAHHEGAIRMIEELWATSTDQFVSALSGDMYDAQSIQIWQMEQMLAEMA